MELLWDIRKDPQLKYQVCDVGKYIQEHDVSKFFGNRWCGLSKCKEAGGMKNTFIGRTCSIMTLCVRNRIERIIFCYRQVNMTHCGYDYFYPWIPLLVFDVTKDNIKQLGSWIRDDHREIPHARKQWERGKDFHFNTYKEFFKREPLLGIYKTHYSILINKVVLDYNTNTNKYIIYFTNDNYSKALHMELDSDSYKLLQKVKRYMELQEIDINEFIGLDEEQIKTNAIAYHKLYGGSWFHDREAKKRRIKRIQKALT